MPGEHDDNAPLHDLSDVTVDEMLTELGKRANTVVIALAYPPSGRGTEGTVSDVRWSGSKPEALGLLGYAGMSIFAGLDSPPTKLDEEETA